MGNSSVSRKREVVRVLLVEQNADDVSLITRLLGEVMECRLEVCSSRHEALEIVSRFQADLVMLSHDLLGQNGAHLLTELRVKIPGIQAIAFLPQHDRNIANRYSRAGVFECISKQDNFPAKLAKALKRASIGILEQKSTMFAPRGKGVRDKVESKPTAFGPDEKILHYRIMEPIGEGGMGEVYKAEDLKLARVVAIKVLPVVVKKDETARKRLLREAQSASSLNHPNIVTIHAVEAFRSHYFIVMEYIEGESLKSMIDRSSLPLTQVLDIGSQIADALQAAHAIGVIHRDIKPSNIMITNRGQAKLLDFGLAKRVQSPSADSRTSTNLTVSGTIIGTVPYMSPEQCRGEPLDARTDIFSLGSVLYNAATKKLPFQGETDLATLFKINSLDPVPPSAINPSLYPEFDAVVQRMLSKDRKDRYSASELTEVLDHLKKAIREGGVTGVETFSPLHSGSRTECIESIAVLPFINVNGDPQLDYLTDGITESLINRLSQLPNLRVLPRSSVFRYKGRDVHPETLNKSLQVRAVLTGRTLQRSEFLNLQLELSDLTTNSQIWGQQYERKLSDIFALQEQLAKDIAVKLRLKLTGTQESNLLRRHTESVQAYHLYLKGYFHLNKRTEEHFIKSKDCFHNAVLEDPEFSLAYVGLADAYNLLGSYAFLPPQATFPQAISAASRSLKIDPELAEAHASLGYSLMFKWDWRNSEKEFLDAIERNPAYSVARLWYGLYCGCMRRFEDGVTQLRKGLEIDPLSLVLSMNIGVLDYFAGLTISAYRRFTSVLEMEPNYPVAYFFRGLAYQEQQMYEEAVKDFQKALSPSRDVRYLSALGNCYACAGKREEAQELLDEIGKLSMQRYVSPLDVAMIHLGLGETEKAMEGFRQAVEEQSSWLIFAGVDPRLDPVRSHESFRKLVHSVGFLD